MRLPMAIGASAGVAGASLHGLLRVRELAILVIDSRPVSAESCGVSAPRPPGDDDQSFSTVAPPESGGGRALASPAPSSCARSTPLLDGVDGAPSSLSRERRFRSALKDGGAAGARGVLSFRTVTRPSRRFLAQMARLPCASREMQRWSSFCMSRSQRAIASLMSRMIVFMDRVLFRQRLLPGVRSTTVTVCCLASSSTQRPQMRSSSDSSTSALLS